MTRIFTLITIIFLSNYTLAQDFSYVASKVAFSSGEILGKLEKCELPIADIMSYEKAIEKMKKDAFPDESYDGYIKLFDESFMKGKESVASAPSPSGADCEKHLKYANEITAHYR